MPINIHVGDASLGNIRTREIYYSPRFESEARNREAQLMSCSVHGQAAYM
jgi:hypothetical protein